MISGMTKLASYLEANGITQARFAEAVGMKQSTISRLCAGKVGISMRQAAKIEQETEGAVPVSCWAVLASTAAGAA